VSLGCEDVSQAQEAKQLRDENTKLRKLVATPSSIAQTPAHLRNVPGQTSAPSTSSLTFSTSASTSSTCVVTKCNPPNTTSVLGSSDTSKKRETFFV
jgi:hypothetical protein